MALDKRIKKGSQGIRLEVKVTHVIKAFPLDATAGVHAKLQALIKSDKAGRVVCITNV